MKILRVTTKNEAYPVYIGQNILKSFNKYQKKFLKNSNKILVITTANIPNKYFSQIKKSLTKNKKIKLIKLVLPEGEKIKNNNFLLKITNLLSKENFDRKDALVALGGGVIGDLSGFAASIFKRGINFVQIPTTLLSQVDSSVGGKTGVNNNYGKNLVGTFYHPKFVLIDTNTLSTLPKREIIAGFAEILKYSLIMNAKFFLWLKNNGKNIINKGNHKIISKAIYESCKCKAIIVKKDEKENHLRAILNFGHTFAHALETVTGYSKKLIHGEAVLIGMMVASRLSNKLKMLSNVELQKIYQIYELLNLSYKYKKFVHRKNVNQIFRTMANDKKSEGSKINIILLKKIGVAKIKKLTLKKTFIPLILNDLKDGRY